MADKSTASKWIFRGHIVTATRNPFLGSKDDEGDEENEVDSDFVRWIGPGLKILLDHVLSVSRDGIIQNIIPAGTEAGSFLWLSRPGDAVSNSSNSTQYVELGPNDFLCPGMIDLHIHAPQFAYTGTATDRPLMGSDGWLETYTFPAERGLLTAPERAKSVYDAVVETTLSYGTTTCVYFATLDLEPCRVLVDSVVSLGQRALVGKVCMDRNSPEDYCQSLEQNLEETEALIDYIKIKTTSPEQVGGVSGSGLPRVLPLITPRFIPTCSPELMTSLGNLAAQHDCHITSHISESFDEVAFSRHLDATMDNKIYTSSDAGSANTDETRVGRTDAEIYDSHGLLTNKCIMAHGVLLSESDLDLMKERGTAVAHCPLSNFFFAGCSLPCRGLMERNNKVGLGTDVAGGYSPSMFDAARSAVVASRSLQHTSVAVAAALVKDGQCMDMKTKADAQHELDYRHAFFLATSGGAEALGWQGKLGRLEIGHPMIRIFDRDTLQDIFQKVFVLGDDRTIKRVFVDGYDVSVARSG